MKSIFKVWNQLGYRIERRSSYLALRGTNFDRTILGIVLIVGQTEGVIPLVFFFVIVIGFAFRDVFHEEFYCMFSTSLATHDAHPYAADEVS